MWLEVTLLSSVRTWVSWLHRHTEWLPRQTTDEDQRNDLLCSVASSGSQCWRNTSIVNIGTHNSGHQNQVQWTSRRTNGSKSWNRRNEDRRDLLYLYLFVWRKTGIMFRSTLREMCVKDTIRRGTWREDLIPLEVSQGGRGLFPLGQFLTQFHGFTITPSSISLMFKVRSVSNSESDARIIT